MRRLLVSTFGIDSSKSAPKFYHIPENKQTAQYWNSWIAVVQTADHIFHFLEFSDILSKFLISRSSNKRKAKNWTCLHTLQAGMDTIYPNPVKTKSQRRYQISLVKEEILKTRQDFFDFSITCHGIWWNCKYTFLTSMK